MDEADDGEEEATKIFCDEGAGNNDEEQSQAVESSTVAESNHSIESLPNIRLIKLHSDSETLSNLKSDLQKKPRTSEGNFTDEEEE